MKKYWISFIAVALSVVLWSCQVFAVGLEWDANQDDTVKYRVYYGIVSGEYLGFEETTLNTHTIMRPDGDWFFVVTAVDEADNESGYSNEVTTNIDTVPPMIPGMLRIIP